MELRDLRCFIAVAEELHFGRAAARLHMSPPPLTERIKKVEAELGAQLFDRTKHSVRLTAAGAALVDDARHVLAQANTMAQTAQRAARGRLGYLRVGFVSLAAFSLSREYAAIQQQLESVNIIWQEMASPEQVLSLRQERMDIAFVYSPIEHPGLAMHRLVLEPMVMAVPAGHRYAQRRAIALQALKSDPFVMPPRHLSPGLYDRVITACHEAGFSPDIPHQTRHVFTRLSLVSIGAGVAPVPRSFATVQLPNVVFLAIRGPRPYVEISAAWRPTNRSPVLKQVLKILGFEPA